MIKTLTLLVFKFNDKLIGIEIGLLTFRYFIYVGIIFISQGFFFNAFPVSFAEF